MSIRPHFCHSLSPYKSVVNVKSKLVLAGFLLCIPASAWGQGNAYYDIDGQQKIIMQPHGQNGTARAVLTDNDTGETFSLHRDLASGGDIVWRENGGQIRMRKTGNGGIIYYPDYRKKGIPLLASGSVQILPAIAMPEHAATQETLDVDEWAKAFPYRGQSNEAATTAQTPPKDRPRT